MLEIYVARHCAGTEEALRLAAEARRVLPGLLVSVRLIDDPSLYRPPDMPGTPAYYLDGRLVFLGNPSLAELKRKTLPAGYNE